MAKVLTEEKYTEILRENAVRKFGEEKAKVLEPAIREIAYSLAFIARQDMALEEEPAFFTN